MINKLIFLAFAGALSAPLLSGQTITLTTTDVDFPVSQTTVSTSNANLMPIGNFVSIGLYDTVDFNAILLDGSVTDAELTSLFNDYVFFGTPQGGPFDDLGEFGSVDSLDIVGPTSGTIFENQSIFMTIFKTFDNSTNLGADWSNVEEVGVFSADIWNFGSTSDPSNASILRTEEINQFLVAADGTLRTVTVVPEPAYFAAVLGLMGLGIVIWRRRRP